MKKNNLIIIAALYFVFNTVIVYAQNEAPANNTVKNVIIMIPDGTSVPVLSLSRWYQWYLDNKKIHLAVDALLCGMVKTYSSNSPIGDSAPTSSCYATGYESQTGYIATYPPKDSNDLVFVDPNKAYQPLLTVLEAAKLSGKSTGLVFTCEFPHATPADFSAHYYNRKNYDVLSKQMVYNNIDVVFGGGDTILKKPERTYLENNGWDTVFNDYKRFKTLGGKKAWALFCPKDMDYDIDRDTSKIPSLATMTQKAISLLSKNNDKGFFLMVEGSKGDWAAHGNDPVGMVTEFLAFDKAVDAALMFAKANGETVVIVCPDHGNSGISIGNEKSNIGYDKLGIARLIEPLKKCSLTSEGLNKKIMGKISKGSSYAQKDSVIRAVIKQYCSIQGIDTAQIRVIIKSMESKYKEEISDAIAKVIASKTYIGFTTTGHTGEDVFLGIYAPKGKERPTGLLSGRELNKYLCRTIGIASLDDSTEKYFSPHKKVFAGCKDTIFSKQGNMVLNITKGKNILEVPANKNVAYLNGKTVKLNTVVVYMDKNKTFYLPESLGKMMEGK